MLADLEIEIFCQFFIQRFFTRDKRAQMISKRAMEVVGYECAAWINLMVVGYARVDLEGKSYFSDKASEAKPPTNL